MNAALRKRIADLQAKEEAWNAKMRQQLNNIAGANRGNYALNANPSSSQGGLSLAYGSTPNDIQFEQFKQQQGGNPFEREYQRLVNAYSKNGKASVKESRKRIAKQVDGETEKSLLDQYIEETQRQIDAANAANEERYQQELQLQNELRDRTMERVENYGASEEEQLKQQYKNNIGRILANLQNRGLSNSTISASMIARNERDLATARQRLSENIEERKAKYDTMLTRDIVGTIDRREDVAPSYDRAVELAMRYGEGNDGNGYREGNQTLAQYNPVVPISYTRPRIGQLDYSGAFNLLFGNGGAAQRPAGVAKENKNDILSPYKRSKYGTRENYVKAKRDARSKARARRKEQSAAARERNRYHNEKRTFTD